MSRLLSLIQVIDVGYELPDSFIVGGIRGEGVVVELNSREHLQ
jgi:hypothetical protein